MSATVPFFPHKLGKFSPIDLKLYFGVFPLLTNVFPILSKMMTSYVRAALVEQCALQDFRIVQQYCFANVSF